MSGNKKIHNINSPTTRVNNTVDINKINSHLYLNSRLVIDFSFEGAFISCKCGDFNNFLKDSNEFITKFRSLMSDLQKLSQCSPSSVFSGEYTHCHKVKDKDSHRVIQIIKELFLKTGFNNKSFDQIVEGEDIYQIGLQSEIRLFGTMNANIFKVYFIDYYHDFNFDQRRNKRNKKICNFCAIKSELH